MILSSRNLVHLILANAVRNALEATTGLPAEEPIVVNWDSTDAEYWVAILDRGRGLPQTMHRVFEIGSTTKKGHLGMGLALAKQAALSLGGRIYLIPLRSSLRISMAAGETMRLLIVEDNEDEIGIFAKELAKTPTIELTFARSRDVALSMIERESYDLVVVDLKIPTVDGGLDSDLHHGLAVHSKLREVANGTPAVIFSGFGTVPLVSEIGDKSNHEDMWGTGHAQALTCFKDKSQFAKCLEFIRSVEEQNAALSEIEISFGSVPLDLDRNQKLVLRLFARLYRGVNIRVERLGGGLSSAQTFRVAVQDAHGATTSYAAAKVGLVGDMERERMRYEQYVSPIVPVGGFAPVSRFIRAGAAGLGGLFYALAREYDSTLADLLRTNPDAAAAVADRVRALEEHWQSGAHIRKLLVSEIRRSFIDDGTMGKVAAKLGFDWQGLEKTEVRVKWCTQHRDLHGLNVLLKNQKEPLLIDFGEVEEAPASLDPLILELSLLFHPECKKLCGSWPTLDQAAQWDNLNAFIVNCPFPSFIRACRKWAGEVDAGDKGMYASAYSFAVRQHTGQGPKPLQGASGLQRWPV